MRGCRVVQLPWLGRGILPNCHNFAGFTSTQATSRRRSSWTSEWQLCGPRLFFSACSLPLSRLSLHMVRTHAFTSPNVLFVHLGAPFAPVKLVQLCRLEVTRAHPPATRNSEISPEGLRLSQRKEENHFSSANASGSEWWMVCKRCADRSHEFWKVSWRQASPQAEGRKCLKSWVWRATRWLESKCSLYPTRVSGRGGEMKSSELVDRGSGILSFVWSGS